MHGVSEIKYGNGILLFDIFCFSLHDHPYAAYKALMYGQ